MWPSSLTFIYPRWDVDAGVWWRYLFPLAALAAFGLLWRFRRHGRGTFAAATIYAVTIAPALGFVDVYPFASVRRGPLRLSRDRTAHRGRLGRGRRRALTRGSARARPEVAGLDRRRRRAPALTWSTAQAYVDATTLYRTTLARNPACWLCHNNLATPLISGSAADLDEAEAHLDAALKLNPEYAEAHNNRGGLLQRRGRFEDARREHEEAFRLNPDLVEALYNEAVCEQALGGSTGHRPLHRRGPPPAGLRPGSLQPRHRAPGGVTARRGDRRSTAPRIANAPGYATHTAPSACRSPYAG